MPSEERGEGTVGGFYDNMSRGRKWCRAQHRGGPIFNEEYGAERDPGSVLHGNLGPVPRFSGGVRVFCYTSRSGPPLAVLVRRKI